MKYSALLGMLMLMASTPALAEEGNPGGKEIGAEVNAVDRVFATAITQGGKAEVMMGELARDKAASSSVKDFAKMMVADHSKANEIFAEIAKKEELPLPKELDPEHEATAKRLKSMDGKKFDVEYMKGQVGDHQKTAQLLQHEIGAGQNEDVKKFAETALPTVLSHLKKAQQIMQELTGQAAG